MDLLNPDPPHGGFGLEAFRRLFIRSRVDSQEFFEMEQEAIRVKIKEIIANVTNIDPQEIDDQASFVDDLQLDSLSLLEIGVDVDYEFKLGVPEERLQELRTVQDSVDLVVECFAAKAATAEVA